MAESDIQRALDEVVEFIRALPAPGADDDLAACIEALTRSVNETAPAFVRRWPILITLFAATSEEQAIEVLVDLAISAKCRLANLTPAEQAQLSEMGLSSSEQLLLARLLQRLRDVEEPP